ncbi:DNA topoisomerase [Lactococcus lactis]|uniref:DNA topoisomerase n=1 Tax=Lactococcus lactis TaxID=1358 RepID=UPI003877F495
METLSHDERLIYETVVKRTLMMFSSDQVIAKTQVKIDNGQEFTVTGMVILKEGWHQYALQAKNRNEKVILPSYKEGELVKVKNALVKGKTQPPARLTEATMLKTVLVKYGLGTSATRATTLAGLVRDEFISLDKKTGQYSPLEKAQKTIQALEELGSNFANPEKTSEWEITLKLIGEGKLRAEEFLQEIKSEIMTTVKGQNK